MKKWIILFLVFISINSISQNPLLLKDVVPGNNTGTIQQIVKTSNYTFFNENDGGASTDRSLYRTDGTPAGTIKLNLSYPGYISTKADKLTALGNKVIFAGDNIAFYGEIWASDGTQAGTVALERFQPISNRTPVVEISAMGSYAYYSVINKDAGGINRAYLKRTDGTAAGTSLIYDFSSFTGVPEVVFLTPVNNILYFIVYDAGGTGVDQLWRSDGTNAGTYMVYNFTTANFVESYIMPAGNNMYIMIGSIVGGVRQNTIWKSDGSAAGTVPVKFVGTGNTNLYPAFAAIGSTLYFAGADGNGKELWKTDGTAAGTFMAADINSGGGNSVPSFLTAFNNNLFFAAENPTYGGELWKYDGSVATLVKDINPGNAASVPQGFVVSGNSLIFSAFNNTSGRELWITDGTSANTIMIADINPGANNSSPNIFTPGNPVYFAANNGINGVEVFKYDNNGDAIGGPNKFYVNDNSTTGDLLTLGVGSNSNNGSKLYPFATISYAVTQTTEGDTIYVDAGTYAEQITIDKGLTIIGAGQNLTSIINPGSPLVSPPGPFPEYALIQTAQNIGDVNISNLQTTNVPANDGHSILLQTGGSVKNCRIIDGGLGVYIRVESAVKSVVVENNFIQASVFAVACQGSGLTASVLNNTLNVTNPGFSVGIWVGMDFGPIVKLTATRNSINNYVYRGIVGNSYNTVLSENSILGTGQYAIENTASLAVATCNWYGTSDQYAVAAKMNGNINFSPWLVNGTDNDAAIGFQPVPGSCGGRQLFCVNDNSLTGDIYTSAVGNNANNGSFSAPLATIAAALAKVQPGDLIIVDAGSYSEIVNVTKNVSILGAGKGVTILNGPAGPVIPFPNTGETGIIQTINGLTDVIVENMTIDGNVSEEQHGIFIQGGGRVSNCELRYVNDGFYFQFISTQPRTAIGNNNYVHHINYVGALFAGNGLNATAINNVIDLTGASYGMGFIAGYGGDGNVASFTASNNSIINVNGFGMMIGSLQTPQVHNNRITRIGGNYVYIQNANSVNIDATCNWYGTTDAGAIIPYMTGSVTYSPWLTSGTDSDVAFGFQPMANVCNGRQNKFYVNDNSLTGDVFTTAIGNDANSGIPSAPLLTVSAALIKAQAGDSIFVDAGTYVTPNLNINKSITILGTNYNASPNNPADRLAINPVRNAEAMITGSTFTISSNDVRLEGLSFNPGVKPQVTMATTGVNNFTFKRNYSIVTSGNFLTLNGPSIPFGQASTFGNYLIDDNRFESQVTTNSLCIVIGALNDVTVNNNTFFTPATSSQRLLTSCSPGSAGLTVNFVYSNNISNAARNEWFSAGPIASATIENNISLNGQRSIIIQISSYSNNSYIQVRNNYIENDFAELPPIQYSRSGTTAAGVLANLLIENNTIIQNGTGRTTVPAAILAQNFTAGSVPSTIIRKNKISFNGDYSSFTSSNVLGVSLTGNWQGINLEENEITFNGTNLTNTIPVSGQSSSGISLSSDNTTNTIPANAIVNITGNKVSGFRNSFAVYDASSVAPNTYVGYGNLPAGVVVNINNNSFTGDVMSINNGTTGQNVNATCNWYGSSIEQDVFNKITTATVQHIPWLTNGTDNDVAVGFQPVPGSCNGYPHKLYVNNNSTTGDVFTSAIGSNANPGTPALPFATLDFALSVAKAGDSIYVDAGAYVTPNITIDKAITILGSNYLINPNNAVNALLPNASRNSEAIISGSTFTIGANNINIEGLTLDPGAKTQITLLSAGFNDFTFKRNYSKVTSGIFISLNGPTIPADQVPVYGNYLIENNRFEKTGTGSVIGITIAYLKDVSVDKNVFITPAPATQRVMVNCYAGFGGIATNFRYTNNTSQASSYDLFTFALASGVIENNTCLQSLRPLFIQSTVPGSSDIQIRNNYVESDFAINTPIYYLTSDGALPGSTTSVLIEGNTVVQNCTGKNFSLLAIRTQFPGTAQNTSLIIRKNKINYTGDYSLFTSSSVVAINIIGKLQTVSMTENEIEFNGTNLTNVLPAGVSSSGILISSDGGPTSPFPSNAVMNITGNKIHGFRNSIAIYDALNAAPNTYTGYGNLPAGVIANINNNSFTGDVVSINNGSIGQSVNATCNWYGTASAQSILAKVTSSTVVYSPWLTSGTDSDIPAVGFQPAGACNGTIPVITLNASTNVTCFGAHNGTINISVSGGSSPFNFSWTKNGDPEFASSSEDPASLAQGTYHLTLTDANGSTAQLEVTITEPTLLTVVASGTSTSCANTATVVASGGTLPYSYAWSNGATTTSITSIPAGTYTVIVTDNKGCTASSSVTVTATEAFNPSASIANVLCFGGSTGSITVTNANGVAPFQYSINGIDFQNSNVFNGLAAGTYTVTVKDVNGCTGFVIKTINQPTQIAVSQGSVQSTCVGSNTGSITIIVTGGSPSYSYLWTGPNSYTSTQANISGLTTGNYNVLVTDSKGCTASLPITVTSFPVINVAANVLNVACRGDANGSIDLTVTGGTGSGFTYLWNNGTTAQDRFNLVAGNYSVTITDIGSSCVVTRSYAISQPASAINLSATSTNVAGCNTLGTITATGSGGTAPYQYKLDAGAYQNSGLFTGLSGGTYTVWVRDANGCTKSVAKTINDGGTDEFENNNNKNNAAAISLGATISARIGTSGDIDYFKLSPSNTWTGNYTLNFVQPSTAVIFDLVASNGTTVIAPTSSAATYKQYNGLNGTYFVRVSGTNSLGCYQLTVTNGLITRSSGSNIQQEVTKASMKDGSFDVKVLGNPSSTGFVMNVVTSSDEKITMRVFDAQGRLIEERQGLQPMEILRIGERYINGVYMAEIRQGKNSKTVRLVKM